MVSAEDTGMTKPRVLLAGAAHVDRIGRLDRPASDGASVPGAFRETPGGAALNVASNLAALGTSVSLASIIANDASGSMVAQALADRGLKMLLQTGQGRTATYTAILQPDGDLVIALADMDIYKSFDPAALTTELAGLPADGWLLADANLESAALSELVGRVANTAALTVSTAKAPRLRGYVGDIDLLFTNRREALALAGMEMNGAMSDAVAALRSLQVSRAVISNGADPAVVLNGAETLEIAPPVMDTLTDVTGAGDALAAGTLARLMEGVSLSDAIRTGIAAAQAILQVEGPWRRDLAKAIESFPLNELKVVPRE